MKIKLSCIVFALIAFIFLSSCSETTELSYENIADMLYTVSRVDESDVYYTEINADNSYILGLNEDEFTDLISKAGIYRNGMNSSGHELCVIKATSEINAAKMRQMLYENYEWVPCENADKIIFASHGSYVVYIKSGTAEADAIMNAFSEITGADISGRLEKNK